MSELNAGRPSLKEVALHKAAINILTNSLGASPGDRILLVFDRYGQEVADGIIDASLELNQPITALYVPVDLQESPNPIERIAGLSDLLQTSTSLLVAVTDGHSSTGFRVALLRLAVKYRLRTIHMPGVGEDDFTTSAHEVDFRRLHQEAIALSEKLTSAHMATVHTYSRRTRKVVTLTLVLKNRIGHADGGLVFAGEIINIPTGEAYIATVEDSANGSIVINGSFPECNLPSGKEIELVFVDGRLNLLACHFPSDGAGDYCRNLLSSVAHGHPKGIQVGELGIGLNSAIRAVAGKTILDEKVLGTAHIAVGSNIPFGGRSSAPYHFDLVFYPHKIEFDGTALDMPWKTRLNR